MRKHKGRPLCAARRLFTVLIVAGVLFLVLVFAFDRFVVLESAELLVRPDDNFLALLQTALDLDVVFAGDAGLDRGEGRLIILDNKHALDGLLVFRGLALRRGGR